MDFTNIIITQFDLIKVIALIVLGIFLGIFAKFIIKKIAKVSIYPEIRKHSPSSYKSVVSGVELTGSIIQWLIIILFLFQALSIFQIFLLTETLEIFIEFFPKLIVGFLIFIVGIIIANIISRKISDMDFKYSKSVSKVAGIILISATVLSALEAINIKVTPFIELFKAGVYALGIIIAITIGIGLGFSLKPEISRFIKELKKN